jgi:uncharacterized protein YjbI with pentapeptide repeats
MSTHYILEQEFQNCHFEQDAIKHTEYEKCLFDRCDFSRCDFLAVSFIDCVFNRCHFDGAKINYVALRTARFNHCSMKDINFSMCNKLLFDIAFHHCVLDFSKFYTLKLKGTSFIHCSLIAVDFMNADLTEVVFDQCDLYRSEFAKAIANKANFKTSYHYSIDPEQTKLKKAIFSLSGVKGLLTKYEIVVE